MFQETDDNLSKVTGPHNDKMRSLPNGLKERLISNIVRDAVLDKAIEDALPRVEAELNGPGVALADTVLPARPAKSPTASPHRKRKGGTARKGKGKKSAEPGAEETAENGPLSSPRAVASGEPREETKSAGSPEERTTSEDKETPPTAETRLSDTSEMLTGDSVEPSVPSHSADTTLEKVGIAPPLFESDSNSLGPLRGPPASEDRPVAPVQHSVFKSFFSTDLSIDDIDRQIEAKRMEWVC
jgi:hypothetical protein